MTEQHQDRSQVGAAFEQVRGEAVPQRVQGNALGQPRVAIDPAADVWQRRVAQRPIARLAEEEPLPCWMPRAIPRGRRTPTRAASLE